MYGWVSRHQQMADIADIWIYIIDKVLRGRLIRIWVQKTPSPSNRSRLFFLYSICSSFSIWICLFINQVSSSRFFRQQHPDAAADRYDRVQNVGASSNSIFVCRCFNSSQIPLYQEGDFNMALNQWKGTDVSPSFPQSHPLPCGNLDLQYHNLPGSPAYHCAAMSKASSAELFHPDWTMRNSPIRLNPVRGFAVNHKSCNGQSPLLIIFAAMFCPCT